MARTASRYVEPLSDDEREMLRYLADEGETARIRRRAHAILLSDAGKSVNEIASIFEVQRNTVTRWLDGWAKCGPAGLGDAPRPGAPPSLTPEQTRKAVELIEENPEFPNQVLHEIDKLTGKKISRSTLRRIARRANLR
jgi:transposase